jgi:hypothetical protein
VLRFAVIAAVVLGFGGGIGMLAVQAAIAPRPSMAVVTSPDPGDAVPAEPAIPAAPAPSVPPAVISDNALLPETRPLPAPGGLPVPSQEPVTVDPGPTSPNWTFVVFGQAATTSLPIGSCVDDEYDKDTRMVSLTTVSCDVAHMGVVKAAAALQDPPPTDDQAMAYVGTLCFPEASSYISPDSGDSYFRYNEWHEFDRPKPMTQWFGIDVSTKAPLQAIRTTTGYLCLYSRATT